MADISQTTFSNAFSWMKMYEFRLRFHWRLLPRVQLTILQHWFRLWLGADQATSHCLNQCWLAYWRIYASLGLNGLIIEHEYLACLPNSITIFYFCVCVADIRQFIFVVSLSCFLPLPCCIYYRVILTALHRESIVYYKDMLTSRKVWSKSTTFNVHSLCMIHALSTKHCTGPQWETCFHQKAWRRYAIALCGRNPVTYGFLPQRASDVGICLFVISLKQMLNK